MSSPFLNVSRAESIVLIFDWNASMVLLKEPSSSEAKREEKEMGVLLNSSADCLATSNAFFQSSIFHSDVSFDCLIEYSISKSLFDMSLVKSIQIVLYR